MIEAPTSVASLAGAAPFTVRGAAPGADALVFEAGLGQRLAGGVSLDLGYEGVLGAGSRTHAVTARLAGPF